MKLRYNIIFVCGLVFVAAILSNCEQLTPLPPSDNLLNEPIADLTQWQLRNHLEGDAAFGHIFSVEEGLGPIFVSTSCESCHAGDGKGHPLTTLTRFGRMEGGNFDPLTQFGGPQLQNSSIAGYPAEVIPSQVTGQSRLLPPAVAGLGFLEAVSDADILAMADPSDADGDGVSGIPSYISPQAFFSPQPHHQVFNGKYIGRFGRKAGAIDLLQQVAGAYINDMGITSEFHPEDLFNVQAGNFSGDVAPEPEVSSTTVRNTVFYMRTLKEPPRRNQNSPQVLAGEVLFTQIGCATCHRPSLQTGFSDISALSNKVFYPYTDLLLHDMGAELDDAYTEGTALTSEWRTTPLWGLGISQNSQGGKRYLLHDGRASTFEAAINFHGGEGAGSRAAFQRLDEAQRKQLIAFLESL